MLLVQLSDKRLTAYVYSFGHTRHRKIDLGELSLLEVCIDMAQQLFGNHDPVPQITIMRSHSEFGYLSITS
jgi:hypothetical protein